MKLQGGLTNEELGNTVNLNFTFGANRSSSTTLPAATLTIGGNIKLGANTLTIGGSNGETDLNGVISGTGGLIASTSSKVVLAGSNSYQGTTQVVSGTLAVSNGTGLGAAAARPRRERRWTTGPAWKSTDR